MEPVRFGAKPEADPEDNGPEGTWFYNQGRSCYTVSMSDDGELYYAQQMASGNVLRGILTPPAAGETEPADGDAVVAPWSWEAELSNQAHIRLRRDGAQMVSSYRKPGGDAWTPPQRSDRQAATEAELAEIRQRRLRALLKTQFIETGSSGRVLGLCRQCGCCAGWTRAKLEDSVKQQFESAVSICRPVRQKDIREARGDELHGLSDPTPSFDGVRFDFPRAAWDLQGSRTDSKLPCGRCGCAEHLHEDITSKLGRFVLQRGVALQTGIPLAALHWTQLELALYCDTGGLFWPQDRVPHVDNGESLVSVICPTTTSRRCFHPFLWSGFYSQTYAPRELIIIDTGQDGPSPFFEEKARADSRLTYKYYNVAPWQWSIGVKRNLGCYFASGRIIAHFDDDDLYAAIYLEEMVKCLRDPGEAFGLHQKFGGSQNLMLSMLAGMGWNGDAGKLRPAPEATGELQRNDQDDVKAVLGGGFGAALAKLASWHTFSLRRQGWGFFNAVPDDDEPFEDFNNSLYGWGFSMVYLRSAWVMCPFLHMNLGEDFDFVRSIRQLNLPTILIPDKRGICAHTHHSDNTAGGMELTDYGSSSALLYGPLGGMIQGWTCFMKALAVVQDQQREEGKSRRGPDGKLRDIATPAEVVAEKISTEKAAPEPQELQQPVQPTCEPKAAPQAKPAQPGSGRSSRKVVAAPPAPVKRAQPPGRFCVISSLDSWKSKEDMKWDGSNFRYEGRLSAAGQRIQILANGAREAVLYPSVPDADLGTAHFLKGPDNKSRGHSWLLRAPAGESSNAKCEVVLSCPEGCALSISWSFDEAVTPVAAEQPVGQTWKPSPGSVLGQWKLLWDLGQCQKAGAAVLLAEADDGSRAAVKCPASLRELQHLAAMRCISGVPPLLGCGNAPCGGAFHVTPATGDSLELLLARCDHDGFGGRLPWPAVQHLGRVLLTSLRGIHSRGLVLGSLSPCGVRTEVGSDQVYIVDFGQSCPVLGETVVDSGSCSCEFDSVRAGFCDERVPADDLEALGWLLWRCVVGWLPWSRLAAMSGSKSGEERQLLRERVAKAKREVFKSGCSIFGPRYSHCPAGLEAYLRCVRGLNNLDGGIQAAKYGELARLLEATDARQTWIDIASGKPQRRYKAAAGRVIWRAAGSTSSMDAEAVRGVGAFTVAATGSEELLQGGRWLELAPVWTLGLPRSLLERRGWVLVADWAEQLLEPLPDSGHSRVVEEPVEVLTEGDLLTSVLGPMKPLGTLEAESERSESSDGEVNEAERERQVQEIAAHAARKYVKAVQQ